MQNIRRIVIAAIAIASIPGAADAQRYFARTKLNQTSTASAQVYTPVYSSTYGACSSGTQSAPITGCKDSSGTAVATSMCSSSPQTTSQSCTANACMAMTANKGVTSSALMGSRDNVTSVAEAKSFCEDGRVAYGVGLCGWNTLDNPVNPGRASYYRNGVLNNDANSYGTYCVN